MAWFLILDILCCTVLNSQVLYVDVIIPDIFLQMNCQQLMCVPLNITVRSCALWEKKNNMWRVSMSSDSKKTRLGQTLVYGWTAFSRFISLLLSVLTCTVFLYSWIPNKMPPWMVRNRWCQIILKERWPMGKLHHSVSQQQTFISFIETQTSTENPNSVKSLYAMLDWRVLQFGFGVAVIVINCCVSLSRKNLLLLSKGRLYTQQ